MNAGGRPPGSTRIRRAAKKADLADRQTVRLLELDRVKAKTPAELKEWCRLRAIALRVNAIKRKF